MSKFGPVQKNVNIISVCDYWFNYGQNLMLPKITT